MLITAIIDANTYVRLYEDRVGVSKKAWQSTAKQMVSEANQRNVMLCYATVDNK